MHSNNYTVAPTTGDEESRHSAASFHGREELHLERQHKKAKKKKKKKEKDKDREKHEKKHKHHHKVSVGHATRKALFSSVTHYIYIYIYAVECIHPRAVVLNLCETSFFVRRPSHSKCQDPVVGHGPAVEKHCSRGS